MMIRPASPDDLEGVAALFAQLHPETPDQRLSPVRQASRFFVAKEDERLVGAVLATLTDYGVSASGMVEELFIDPEHRGKGIGRDLIEACARWLTDEGVEVMFVSSLDEAERFYIQTGFERCRGPWLYRALES